MKKTFTIERLFLLILLSVAFIYSNISEVVPREGGLGWDGVGYYNIIKSFSDDYFTQGIDKYHMLRVFPFIIVHYIFLLFHIEPSIPNAILGMRLLNALCIGIMVMYFFKLSKLRNWGCATEIIAFSFVFFTYDICKLLGYNPVGTSGMTQLLSLSAVYYYFKQDTIKAVINTLLLLFTWPIGSILLVIMLSFPRQRIMMESQDKFSVILNRLFRVSYVFWVPGLILLYTIASYIHKGEFSLFKTISSSSHRMALNGWIAWAGTISAMLFYYYASKSFTFDWKGIFRSIFQRRRLFIILGSFIVFVCVYIGGSYYGSEAQFSLLKEIIVMFQYPTSDIFYWIETHFVNLGLLFIFIILFWKQIILKITDYGIGYLFVALIGLVMCMDAETRKLTSFIPIFLVPLMDTINKLKFKQWVTFVIVAFQYVNSYFWIQQNMDGVEKFVDRFSYDAFMSFPAQGIFMFNGQFQNHEMYYLFGIELLIVMFIMWTLSKRNTIWQANE